jgi:hypothetical protein
VDVAELLDEHGLVPVVQALPAVAGIVADPQESQLPHFPEQVVERHAILFPDVHVGIDLPVYESPDGRPERLMGLVEIHRLLSFSLVDDCRFLCPGRAVRPWAAPVRGWR